MLSLDGLTSVEGLTLPKHVKGDLSIDGLTSAVGLTLPETIGGLSLDGLTSAVGLTLPKHVREYLFLNGLTSVEGRAARGGRRGGDEDSWEGKNQGKRTAGRRLRSGL